MWVRVPSEVIMIKFGEDMNNFIFKILPAGDAIDLLVVTPTYPIVYLLSLNYEIRPDGINGFGLPFVGNNGQIKEDKNYE